LVSYRFLWVRMGLMFVIVSQERIRCAGLAERVGVGAVGACNVLELPDCAVGCGLERGGFEVEGGSGPWAGFIDLGLPSLGREWGRCGSVE
jgi:hypothetical protein